MAKISWEISTVLRHRAHKATDNKHSIWIRMKYDDLRQKQEKKPISIDLELAKQDKTNADWNL